MFIFGCAKNALGVTASTTPRDRNPPASCSTLTPHTNPSLMTSSPMAKTDPTNAYGGMLCMNPHGNKTPSSSSTITPHPAARDDTIDAYGANVSMASQEQETSSASSTSTPNPNQNHMTPNLMAKADMISTYDDADSTNHSVHHLNSNIHLSSNSSTFNPTSTVMTSKPMGKTEIANAHASSIRRSSMRPTLGHNTKPGFFDDIIGKGLKGKADNEKSKYEEKKARDQAKREKDSRMRLAKDRFVRENALKSRLDLESTKAKLLQEMEKNVMARMESDLQKEIRDRVFQDEAMIASAYKDEIKASTKAQLIEDLECLVKAELSVRHLEEVRNELKLELTPSAREEVRNELKLELTSSVRNEVRNELKLELISGVRDEVRNELKLELTSSVRKELELELPSGVQEEAEARIHPQHAGSNTNSIGKQEPFYPDLSNQQHLGHDAKASGEQIQSEEEDDDDVFQTAPEQHGSDLFNTDLVDQQSLADHFDSGSSPSRSANLKRPAFDESENADDDRPAEKKVKTTQYFDLTEDTDSSPASVNVNGFYEKEEVETEGGLYVKEQFKLFGDKEGLVDKEEVGFEGHGPAYQGGDFEGHYEDEASLEGNCLVYGGHNSVDQHGEQVFYDTGLSPGMHDSKDQHVEEGLYDTGLLAGGRESENEYQEEEEEEEEEREEEEEEEGLDNDNDAAYGGFQNPLGSDSQNARINGADNFLPLGNHFPNTQIYGASNLLSRGLKRSLSEEDGSEEELDSRNFKRIRGDFYEGPPGDRFAGYADNEEDVQESSGGEEDDQQESIISEDYTEDSYESEEQDAQQEHYIPGLIQASNTKDTAFVIDSSDDEEDESEVYDDENTLVEDVELILTNKAQLFNNVVEEEL